MEFAENEFISSVDELSSNVDERCSKVPIISDYCKSLDGNVKWRYLEKVAVIAVDPITIPDEHFSSGFLPPVEATDLLSYLVLETSFYTKQQFKAYKSLEAYNSMVSVYYQCPGLRCSWKVHCDRKGETFTTKERSFNLNLGHCR